VNCGRSICLPARSLKYARVVTGGAQEFLAAVAECNGRPQARIAATSDGVEQGASDASTAGILHSLYNRHSDPAGIIGVDLTVSALDVPGRTFPATYVVMGDEVRLVFDDGGYVVHLLDELGFKPPGSSRWHDDVDDDFAAPRRYDLDIGPALLGAITVAELNGIERLLAELERLVEGSDLTALQEQRVHAMSAFIRDAQTETEPGVTPRWRLVGPVRAALRYVVRDLPRDGLALVKFVELLGDIGWTNIL
jgi:hypothetical protein